jgi:hypothetical protein
MADLGNIVFAEEYKDKVVTVQDFREKHCDNITSQAVNYACVHDLIDWVQMSNRVKMIVLSPKTLSYQPNKNKNRHTHKSTLELN